jgi:ubiquinone/menaquinone biosynthesis C-methylase UbiE
MLELTPGILSGLPKNGPTDPIEYYRRPIVGRFFRGRINMGLRLLPPVRYARALEVGYGAGAVLLALASAVDDLHGIDLDAAPAMVASFLESRGHRATLVQGSVYELPYADGFFDLVVCFSVFEHLREYDQALGEVSRALGPNGYFLLGMPSVNRIMELGFRAIGFKGIGDHHITTPAQVARSFSRAGLEVVASKRLDAPLPPLTLYHTWLLRRTLER